MTKDTQGFRPGYFVILFNDEGRFYGFMEYLGYKFTLYSTSATATGSIFKSGSGYVQRWQDINITETYKRGQLKYQGSGKM